MEEKKEKVVSDRMLKKYRVAKALMVEGMSIYNACATVQCRVKGFRKALMGKVV